MFVISHYDREIKGLSLEKKTFRQWYKTLSKMNHNL